MTAQAPGDFDPADFQIARKEYMDARDAKHSAAVLFANHALGCDGCPERDTLRRDYIEASRFADELYRQYTAAFEAMAGPRPPTEQETR